MAISRLTGQDAQGTSTTTSVSATYTSTPTVGNTMIAAVYANVGIGLDSISGWTVINSMSFSGVAQSIELFARIVQSGDGKTVTCSGATGATVMAINIYEYTGLAATITTDGTNTASSGVTSVTSIASGNISTTNANDLLLINVGIGGNSAGSQVFTNSFGLRQIAANGRLFDGDQIVGSTGTYSTTASWSASLRSGILITAVKGTATTTVNSSTLMSMGVG